MARNMTFLDTSETAGHRSIILSRTWRRRGRPWILTLQANRTTSTRWAAITDCHKSHSEHVANTMTSRWIKCPQCRGEVGLPLEWAESTVECPKCATTLSTEPRPEVKWRPSEDTAGVEVRAASTGVTHAETSLPTVPDWRRPWGIIMVCIGALAFLASAVIGGDGDLATAVFAGALNPLFFVCLPLGIYWLRLSIVDGGELGIYRDAVRRQPMNAGARYACPVAVPLRSVPCSGTAYSPARQHNSAQNPSPAGICGRISKEFGISWGGQENRGHGLDLCHTQGNVVWEDCPACPGLERLRTALHSFACPLFSRRMQ